MLGFRRRLILSHLLVALLGGGALGGWLYFSAQERIIDAASERLLDSVRLLAQGLHDGAGLGRGDGRRADHEVGELLGAADLAGHGHGLPYREGGGPDEAQGRDGQGGQDRQAEGLVVQRPQLGLVADHEGGEAAGPEDRGDGGGDVGPADRRRLGRLEVRQGRRRQGAAGRKEGDGGSVGGSRHGGGGRSLDRRLGRRSGDLQRRLGREIGDGFQHEFGGGLRGRFRSGRDVGRRGVRREVAAEFKASLGPGDRDADARLGGREIGPKVERGRSVRRRDRPHLD